MAGVFPSQIVGNSDSVSKTWYHEAYSRKLRASANMITPFFKYNNVLYLSYNSLCMERPFYLIRFNVIFPSIVLILLCNLVRLIFVMILSDQAYLALDSTFEIWDDIFKINAMISQRFQLITLHIKKFPIRNDNEDRPSYTVLTEVALHVQIKYRSHAVLFCSHRIDENIPISH